MSAAAEPLSAAERGLVGGGSIALVLDATLAVYVASFAFEGALRYGLHLVGADALIYGRDGLVLLCLGLLFVERLALGRGVGPYLWFAAAMLAHGVVGYLALGSWFAVAFGVKICLTFLLGVVAWRRLLEPASGMRAALAVVLAATIVAVFLDKFLLDFPWVGVTIVVGGVEMEIGRQWWTQEDAERAGGLARSSIEIAQIAPLLTLTVLGYVRPLWARAVMLGLALAVVYWTTQKGAVLAFALVAPLLLLPSDWAGRALGGLAIFVLALMIGLPVVLPYYEMPSADGVFSPMSFYMRVEDVWPQTWAWIEREGTWMLGVGLGTTGGVQRFVTPELFTPIDNMFLFFLSWFGVPGVVYLLAMVCLALMQPRARHVGDLTARALLCFVLGYGVVLTVVESQMGSLFLGAAVGALAARAEGLRADAPVRGPTPQGGRYVRP